MTAARAALAMRTLVAAAAIALACATTSRAQGPARMQPAPAAPAPVVFDLPLPTREEIDAVLASLAEAHRREDEKVLVALHDPHLKPMAGGAARGLFRDRNYFKLSTRVLDVRPAPEGRNALDVEVLQVLRSRRVTESADRREKARWVYSMGRRDGRVLIVSSHAAPPSPLPVSSPWEPKSFTGRVVLRPASGRVEGEAEIRVDVSATNISPEPQRVVALLLHPFADGVEVRLGETLLDAERTEGSLDTWRVTLPEAVPASAPVTLAFSYRIDEMGLSPTSSIGPDGARLLAESSWLPVLRPTRRDDPIRATHDLVVETPADLAAALPGRLESIDELPGGRRAWRWRSQQPGGDLLLLAGRWRHERVRASDRVSVDVFRASEAPPRIPQSEDPGLIARAVSMVKFLEGFAPAPVDRFTLVEGATIGFVSAPDLMALPDFEENWGRSQEKETQPPFFVAHHLAHAWVVDRAAPTGLGSSHVAEGICDHLASAWVAEEVDAALPRLYRGSILGGIGTMANADRPLIASPEPAPFPEVFGIGKSMLSLDTYRRLAGDAAWRERLAAWLMGPPGRDISALLLALGDGDPILERYCRAFFLQQGYAEARLLAVRLRDFTPQEAAALSLDRNVWHRCEVDVTNVGLGPIPLRIRADINGNLEIRDIVLDEGVVTVPFDAMGLPRSVVIDPDRVLWTSTSDDDFWPEHPPKPREEFGRVLGREQPSSVDGLVSPWRDELPPARR